jgi:hypothetical protein
MTLNSDTTFFCPDDAANIFLAANPSISQTFALTIGQATAVANSSIVSVLGPGSQATFSYTATPTFAITNGSSSVTASSSVLADSAGNPGVGCYLKLVSNLYRVAAVSANGLTITLATPFTETTQTTATGVFSTAAIVLEGVATDGLTTKMKTPATAPAGSQAATNIPTTSAIPTFGGTPAAPYLSTITTSAAACVTTAGVNCCFGWAGASQQWGQALVRRIFVGTTGNVVVTMAATGRTVTFYGVQAGSWRDGCFASISSATTASNLTICK